MKSRSDKHRSLRAPGLTIVAIALLAIMQCATSRSKQEHTTAPSLAETVCTPLHNSLADTCRQFDVPGLTIVVTYKERLVYSDAVGYADREDSEPVSPESLFRIASVSKVITEIALLKLSEEKKLQLDDVVLGENGILGTAFGTPPKGSQIDKITVRNLMDHKSGWTNSPNDPMFNYPGLSQKDLITLVVTTRKLASAPGSTYYYLNFGYCVLGRVIEKITGMTYEEYVQREVLAPCGISDMQIGRNSLADRLPGEVKYYPTLGEVRYQTLPLFSPYNLDVARMDSHGGWVASAIDLAKFMTRIDREPIVPDIVSSEQMKGTYLGYETWWKNGSLPGTTSIVCRLNSDINFVVLANTRTELDPNRINKALRIAISSYLEKIQDWP